MRAKPGSAAAIISIALIVLLFGIALGVALNRQRIVDQVAVWQYEPSGTIAQLADVTAMTAESRFYFYASRPVLEATSKFNEECKRREENSAILGCYSAGKIFIYDVQDERLAGVKEVTAAHEMLHAAYARLDDGEKSRINQLLDAEYKKKLQTDDVAFRERMEYYARTEPGERDNELHSIFATELEELPDELEQYFARYFTDRKVVVALHAAYSDKFDELRDGSEELKVQLDTLAAEIDSQTGEYNNAIRVLNDDIEHFNRRAESGEFASQAEFSAARALLVNRVDEQSQRRRMIDTKVADYEAKRTEYNGMVDETKSLTRSLDSSLAPAPAL